MLVWRKCFRLQEGGISIVYIPILFWDCNNDKLFLLCTLLQKYTIVHMGHICTVIIMEMDEKDTSKWKAWGNVWRAREVEFGYLTHKKRSSSH